MTRLLAAAYFCAVVVYVTWGTLEGRGLPGWVIGTLLERFDWSSDELVSSLIAIFLLLPLSLFRRRLNLLAPFSRAETGLLYATLCLTPGLLGWMGYTYMIRRDALDTDLPLETVTLNAPSMTALSPQRHLVHLANGGYLLSEAQRYVKEDYGEEHFLYVPFVANDKAQQPVQFVLVNVSPQEQAFLLGGTTATPIPVEQDSDFVPVTLDGVAQPGTVPVYVEKAWREAGLKLATPYFLVEPRMLVDGRLPSQLGALKPEYALYLGSLVSLMFGLGIGIGSLRARLTREK